MGFRDRLIATLRAARPVLASPGILVVGSAVPNLFEPGAAATLVVSQDLDIGVPVDRHRELAPPRLIVFVSAERARQHGSARPLAVRLSAERLAADCLVLARFPHARA